MGTRTIIPGSNNAGQIGSESKYWNKGYFNTLHVNEIHTSSTSTLSSHGISITSGEGIVFEGLTADEYETQFFGGNATADRLIVLPDASGTIALTSDVPSAYTLPLATTSVRGGVELGSDTDLTETYETGGTGTASRTYPVQLNAANQMGVSVPWTDTNTTYSAGTGIDLSTTTFNLDLTEVITDDGADRVLTSDGDGTLTAQDSFTVSTVMEYTGNTVRLGDTQGTAASLIKKASSGASYHGGDLTIEAGHPQAGVASNKNAGDLILKSGYSTGTGDPGKVEIWANKEYGSSSGSGYNPERVADFTNPGGEATFRITDDDDDFCKIAVSENTTISTSSSGGNGNLTLDVQGTIVLNADAGTIDFKDDSAFIARMDTNGLSFNTNIGAGISFEGATSNTYETSLNVVEPTDDRTINLPNASGTVQLQGPSTGQIINVSLMKDDNFVLYLNTRTYWYSTAGSTYTGNTNVSAGNWSSWSDDRQARHCGYIASQACKVNKVRFVGLFQTSYTSGALDFEFAIQKWTPGNNTTSSVTTTYMTHTDHNGSYTEGSIYNLEFDVSGNNTLAAGDAFTLFARCVDSNTSARIQLWYGNCWAEVELT